MPSCAIPPVDQSSSQLGWHDGWFIPQREESGAYRVRGEPAPMPFSHRGLDFMADEGSPVVAPWPGTVIAKGYQPQGLVRGEDGLGHYVVVSHGVLGPRVNRGHPVATMYSQMRDASPLNVGDRLEQGALIGYVGRTGFTRRGSRVAAEREEARPLLYFQAVLPTTLSGRTPNWEHGGVGIHLDIHRDFLQPLGLEVEGGQNPGPRIEPWEQVPTWGGRLVQRSECAPSLRGLRGLGAVNPQSIRSSYSRHGSTQLSVSTPYAPAVRSSSASSSGGALLFGLGLVAGAWWLFRPRPVSKAPPWSRRG